MTDSRTMRAAVEVGGSASPRLDRDTGGPADGARGRGPTTAVILAAGPGTRIGAEQVGIPKPLTNLLGASLLCRAIDTAQLAGLDRVVVVTGYQAARVEAHLRSLAATHSIDIEVVRNERWMHGNGSSLAAAEAAIGDRCIVLMADHLTPPSFVRRLAHAEFDGIAGLLVVDRDPTTVHDLAEATKVRLDGLRIVAIGKELGSFDAIDTGVFMFDKRVFDALREAEVAGASELSVAVQNLADAGLMYAIVGDGSFWCDVDTPEDLAFARRSVAQTMQQAIVDPAGTTELASV